MGSSSHKDRDRNLSCVYMGVKRKRIRIAIHSHMRIVHTVVTEPRNTTKTIALVFTVHA